MRRVDVVLVRPLRPGNIGAAARAMENLGAGRLVLVSPCDHLATEALQLAYGAQDRLNHATVAATLAEAVASYRCVVGTTARAHRGYGPADLIGPVRRTLLSRLRRGRIALVFGSEQNGLVNEEIALCHRLIRLPMAVPAPSYNLAQAVLLSLYELFTAADHPLPAPARSTATSQDLERMYDEWAALLSAIGFLNGSQGGRTMIDLRRIFHRADLNEREVRIIRGLLRQTLWREAHPKSRPAAAPSRQPSGNRSQSRADEGELL
ncbi:MAG TPA: TrmJ/YjtD family RNA methyltransferase [Nitrospiria bacterium]|nr:TrmJ/YjtD family RNA methyltransferase [Nitrospiria bacterium]